MSAGVSLPAADTVTELAAKTIRAANRQIKCLIFFIMITSFCCLLKFFVVCCYCTYKVNSGYGATVFFFAR